MHFFRVPASAAVVMACAASASFAPFYAAAPPNAFGLARRDDLDGYQPNSTVCDHPGNTCAEVCGPEYATCASTKSDETHCFKPSAGEICCPDGSGQSCEKGFVCTNEVNNPGKKNWCCPDGMDLNDCALKFGVSGPLELAKPAAPVSPSPAPTPIAQQSKYAAPPASTGAPVAAAPLPPSNNTVGSVQPLPTGGFRPPNNNNTITAAGSVSGFSPLLLAMAGLVALL